MKTLSAAATLLLVTIATSEASAQYGQGYGGQSGYGQQQPPSSGMEAGGLAPPSGSVDNDPYATTSPTEQELERAEREDSGRGLEFFWINAEFGFEHLGLQTFKANNLVDAGVVETNPTGLLYGGGLGVRLVFITLGARFRLGNFPEWQLWTLNAELGLRIPLGALEPYFTFGGGYASLGAFDANNVGGDLNQAGVDVTGYNIRGGFGMDYYFSGAFSLGANLTGELLFLTRPGVSLSDLQAAGSGSAGGSSAELSGEVYAADGSSIGSGVTLTLVAGLHF